MELSAESHGDGRLTVNATGEDGNSYGFELSPDAPPRAFDAASSMLIEKLAGVSKADILFAVADAMKDSRKG